MIAPRFREKKCGACLIKFKPTRTLQEACSVPCSIELVKIKQRKKADKEHREAKKNIKPMRHWLKLTQSVVNRWVVLRDAMDSCISCEESDVEEWHASHYRSVAAASHLRFDPRNIHKGCSKCNTHLSGNIEKYRINLIYKIGLERVEALENDNSTKSWTREELEEIRKHYRKLIRELEGK